MKAIIKANFWALSTSAWINRRALAGFFIILLSWTFSRADPGSVPFVVDLKIDATGLNHQANLRLGAIEMGKDYSARVRLQNNTSQTFSFDNVGTSCACQSFLPRNAIVKSGEFVDCVLRISSEGRPNRAVGAGVLEFLDKKVPVGRLYFSYGQSNFLGFPVTMVVVDLDSGTNEEEFSIPVETGDGVDTSKLQFELEGSGLRFSSEFDQKEGLLRAKISTNEDLGDEAIYANLTVRSTSQKLSSSIPLIVRRQPEVLLRPNSLRLKQSSENGLFEGVLFARSKKFAIEEESVPVQAYLQVGGVVEKGKVESLGTELRRIRFKLPADLGDWMQSDAPKGRIRLKYGSESFEKELPIFSLEYSK